MKFIKSIIPYIDQEQFSKGLANAPQQKKLFDLICAKSDISDFEANNLLCKPRTNKDAYKQVKLRLRDKLIEHVAKTGVPHKNLDTYAKKYGKCLNQLSAVKALIAGGARSAAVALAEQLINTTIKNEFTDLTLAIARDLYYYYSTLNHDVNRSRKYNRVFDEAQHLYQRELEAHKGYCDVRAVFLTSRGALKDSTLAKATVYSEKLVQYLHNRTVSYQLIVDVYNVLVMKHLIARDYHKLIEVCDEVLELFEQRKVKRKIAYYMFDLYKIEAFIQLGEYESVEKIADKYFRTMTRGLYNWVILNLYVLVSRLHSKKYQHAYNVLEEVLNDKGYSKITKYLQEVWTVYEAHIEFLIAIGKINAERPSKFRVNKFLNEIPLYSKDKQGLNIAILIIHVLFLLQQRKYGQIIDRVDALKQYCYRYLRKDGTFRSHCFIRMLLQMPRADFNRIRTERYAEQYVKKLHSVPLRISEQSIEVEVIPYEHLWEMTLELLD